DFHVTGVQTCALPICVALPFLSAGTMPLYRLDRLSGRYLSLEQERNAGRTVYALQESRWFDVWDWLHGRSWWLEAQSGSAVYMRSEERRVGKEYRCDK